MIVCSDFASATIEREMQPSKIGKYSGAAVVHKNTYRRLPSRPTPTGVLVLCRRLRLAKMREQVQIERGEK